jgi:3-dehydroquinate synthase
MVDSQTYSSFSVKSSVKGEYTVHFINELHEKLIEINNDTNCVFIIDSKIKELFKDTLDIIFSKARFVIIDCSESNKTVNYALEVIELLLGQNVRTNDTLIAVGGGITQDLVAFISTILYRGIEWKFFPTTLLAQCDSCIGSKSSINFNKYKNLLGTFSPPDEIFIYHGFLNTLTESEIRSGIGEMLHYYFTEESGLYDQIGDNFENIITDRSKLAYYIHNSLRIKKKIIEIDEFDKDIRHIFNYGHTFGHAIEAITNYAIPHGQAISIGMDIANFISVKKTLLSEELFEKMHKILKKNIPPFKLTSNNIEVYCQALARDKKNKGNLLGCILSKGPGKVEKYFIEIDEELKSTLLLYSELFGY